MALIPLLTAQVVFGRDGFLGSRGSLLLDVVFLAMFAVVPAVAVSWYVVRVRKRYAWHRGIQTALAIVLLLAVAAFEIDMRLHGWRQRATPSPYWRPGAWNDAIDWSLTIHLACAVPTFFLWALVVIRAWRQFPSPPRPAEHSAWHRVWGPRAALGMAATALTGWIFYYLAFVATR